MSIAAANLFTRNIYREYLRPDATDAQEARVSKITIYAGFLALIVNLVVAALGTLLARAIRAADGPDATRPDDYTADQGDPRVHELEITGST